VYGGDFLFVLPNMDIGYPVITQVLYVLRVLLVRTRNLVACLLSNQCQRAYASATDTTKEYVHTISLARTPDNCAKLVM
jgi:hypothetical protein